MLRPFYDFCLFNNELEILDIRLKYMGRFIHRFFVCEANLTYQGKAKEFWSRDFLNKYPIATELVNEGKLIFVSFEMENDNSYFGIEHRHRIQFSNWVKLNVCEDFDGIFSDCDEIIDESILSHLNCSEEILSLGLKVFYFAADNMSYRHPWSKPKLFRSSSLLEMDFQSLRMTSPERCIPDMGWHFSSFGGISQILDKLRSFSHTEFSNSSHIDRGILLQRMISRRDYLDRNEFPLLCVRCVELP